MTFRTRLGAALAVSALLASGEVQAQQVSAEDLMAYTPRQKDVEVDMPTKADLAQMKGRTPEAVEKALRNVGTLQVWQYGVRRGISGEMEQAPVRKIAIADAPSTRIEPYTTPLKVVSVSDEIRTEPIQ